MAPNSGAIRGLSCPVPQLAPPVHHLVPMLFKQRRRDTAPQHVRQQNRVFQCRCDVIELPEHVAGIRKNQTMAQMPAVPTHGLEAPTSSW
eukprot:CAMPEP_0202867498 /NCGR_PEP_ID=MMETSP1391-20130828/9471_1 /ASSEMBLY_ACC=CAM_ASM_000867 /TAXON_ID=1034604 /ORGANISM="Chlamydomonas leiostraca, Strain SAG 11-49" /LENGTH=89 /DNA_ID=CAMNT_0049547547 /DNA_START=549 /DNA_END=815 /DNA_ORIENTATION=+